jgi:hypothetical protein
MGRSAHKWALAGFHRRRSQGRTRCRRRQSYPHRAKTTAVVMSECTIVRVRQMTSADLTEEVYRAIGMSRKESDVVVCAIFDCQCRHKTPTVLPTLPIRAAVSLGGDAVGTLQ